MPEQSLEEKFEIFLSLARQWDVIKKQIIKYVIDNNLNRYDNEYKKYVQMYKKHTGKSLPILLGKIRSGKLKLENI